MKKKNLLLSSLALLVVAIVGFVGATYAWFVSDVAPNIGKIDVEVVSVGKVALGVKGPGSKASSTDKRKSGDFVYTLAEQALKDAQSNADWDGWYNNPNNYSTRRPLDAITPQFDLASAGIMKKGLLFDTIGGRDNTLLFETEDKGPGSVDDEVNYIAFDLYFKNMGEVGADPAMQIAFDASGIVGDPSSATGGTGSKFYVDEKYPFGPLGADKFMTPAQKELPKALRVAFVTYTNTLAADLSTEPDSNDAEYEVADIKVWQPNTTALLPATGAVRGTDAGNQMDPTDFATQEDNYSASATADVAFGAGSYIKLFDIEPSGSTEATFYSQEIVKLTIYIWLEGNDQDCVSAIAGGGFTSIIKFATAEV